MPLPVGLGWAAAVAVMGALVSILQHEVHFAPGACERIEPHISSRVVGQELAVRQLADAVCDHLASGAGRHRPLVLSLHGPPGVGKSLSHRLLAEALYSERPGSGLACPGADCAGYKVLYGMDYLADERSEQHAALREALLQHLRRAPDSLIVVEEYDKLDCPTRGLFRTLIENGAVANVTLDRAVVVLESNTGYVELHSLLEAAARRHGGRAALRPEAAHRALKDLVFQRWAAQGCEERTDTLKLVGLVDFFLPFFPLERAHVRRLFEMGLQDRAAVLAARRLGGLSWEQAVIDFLVDKVDFDGDYPVEGGKEAGMLLMRYASRALRDWEAAQRARLSAAEAQQRQRHKGQKGQRGSGAAASEPRLPTGRLAVWTGASGVAELRVQPVEALAAS